MTTHYTLNSYWKKKLDKILRKYFSIIIPGANFPQQVIIYFKRRQPVDRKEDKATQTVDTAIFPRNFLKTLFKRKTLRKDTHCMPGERRFFTKLWEIRNSLAERNNEYIRWRDFFFLRRYWRNNNGWYILKWIRIARREKRRQTLF